MNSKKGIISGFQKRLIVVSVSMMTSAYVFAACGNAWQVPMGPDVVNAPKMAAENAIKAALNGYDARMVTSLQTHEGAIMAALAILTKQKELTADYVSQSDDRSNQVLASVINETEKMDVIKQVIENNSAKGQGHNPCQVLVEQAELVTATEEADGEVYGSVRQEITAAPGKYQNRKEVIAQRTVIHDANYCTADQAASGMCTKEAPRAAKSLKASTLFTASGKGDTIHEDKVAFINNFVGFPAEPLSQSQAQTIGGTSYVGNVHRLNAIRSPAMTALKQLQAEYTASGSPHHYEAPKNDVDTSKAPADGVKPDGTVDVSKIDTTTEKNQALKLEMLSRETGGADSELVGDSAATKTEGDITAGAKPSAAELDVEALPIILQLEKQVARYLGSGDEYKKWNETLIEQNDKGLLKETLQIKALKLFLQTREYEQLLGIEAMLAATVAADLRRSGLEAKVESTRTTAVRNAVNSSIRQQ